MATASSRAARALPCLPEEDLAGRRHRDLAVPALQQPHPDLCLELADRLRQGRLGDVQRSGGAGHMAGLGDGDEVAPAVLV